MSDLISRTRAIENIWDVFNSYANDSLRFDEYETEAINNAFKVLQKVIEGQPIAYDEEKVVEEMKKMRNEDNQGCKRVQGWKCHLYSDCGLCIMDRAIDTVRKGGAECIK